MIRDTGGQGEARGAGLKCVCMWAAQEGAAGRERAYNRGVDWRVVVGRAAQEQDATRSDEQQSRKQLRLHSVS